MLAVEKGYYDLTERFKSEICNGAGAAGDWRSFLIPNTMYGLSCLEAFNIHDYAYYVGVTREDKYKADIALLSNLLCIINIHGGFLRLLRRHRALVYYDAVVEFGDDAFFTKQKGNLQCV